MDTLTERDLRAGLRLLQDVGECAGDWRSFARAGVQALPALVASEITTLSVCDLRTGHRQVIGAPENAISDADRACFDRFFDVHPLVRFHALQRGRGTHRISDSQPFARFRETALYNDYYRRIGIDHVVAVPVHVDAATLVSFVLNRCRRDFSDRECAALDLVREHLAQMYRRARELEQWQTGAHRQAAPDRDADRPAVTLAPVLTPREHEVMRWLAAGKTDRDIGALLGCSHRTVQKHLQRIYPKLGVETRTAAVMRVLATARH